MRPRIHSLIYLTLTNNYAESLCILNKLIIQFLLLISSVVRWLSFKSCPIGNIGVQILHTQLRKMQLQVLVFERCGLGDEACVFLANILKVIESVCPI